MLGLFFLYFIGKSFFTLAEYHQKSTWGFAVAGVISYYASIFIGGIILGLLLGMLAPQFLEETSDTGLGFMCLPFGFLGCWGFYKFLENRWVSNPVIEENSNLLDQGL